MARVFEAEFSAVTEYQGGDLEALYDDLAEALEDSESKAGTGSSRIDDGEHRRSRRALLAPQGAAIAAARPFVRSRS